MRRLNLTFAMRPGLLERLFTPDALGRLAEVSNFDPVALDCFDGAAARSVLAETEVLVTGWGSPPLTAEILTAVPRLSAVIHAAGSVKSHLPTDFWARGIPVSTAAAVNAIPVAEYTLGAILFANKAVLPIAAAYRDHPPGPGPRPAVSLGRQLPQTSRCRRRLAGSSSCCARSNSTSP